MKSVFFISFILISSVIFSQKRVAKEFETKAKEIEISTAGLDDFVIENSDSKFIEIHLYAENPDNQHIVFEEKNNIGRIEFDFYQFKENETVFRKFITKRLNRASAVVKIPKHKKVTIFGKNIDITSKNYLGDLEIFIEKGILRLNEVRANVKTELYAGDIYAILKNTNIELVSNIGKININDVLIKKSYQKKDKKSTNNFIVNSIKANIFLIVK